MGWMPTLKPFWTPSLVYKARLESVEASTSNPYIYYNMQLQAIIKSGMSKKLPGGSVG